MTNAEIQRLIDENEPLPAGLTTTGSLELGSYAHPLPAGLTTTGSLELRSYAHPLPAGLLSRIKNDLFEILTVAYQEIPALQKALVDGKVDGSTYDGPCRCLVGTLERSGTVSLPHRASRPAEQWFIGINKGDTPATNEKARIAAEWVDEFLQLNPTPPRREALL